MNNDRELLQQWLQPGAAVPVTLDATRILVNALRARLSQCERCGEKNPAEIHTCSPQEPLPAKSKGALSHEENKQHNKKILDKFYEENAHLYTAPPQREWQGLTDEDLEFMPSTHRVVAKLAEAKLKEKNT